MAPGLDVSRGDGYGSLALYSGSVPVHRYGLGTRRLTSLAIQKLSVTDKSTLLIDEAESGLEPHRVIGLIEALRSDKDISQVFLTTHSSNAVESCSAAEIAILANRSGVARCSFVPEELEGLHRSNPSPFLARSIIVVEGQTEEGLYRAFAERHDDESRTQGDPTLAARGVCLCQGNGGSSAVSKAIGFASLGYKVALLVDADDSDTNDKLESARQFGVRIFTWPNGWSTESAIFDALEKEQISQLLEFIADEEIVPRERISSDFSNNGLGAFRPLIARSMLAWQTRGGREEDSCRFGFESERGNEKGGSKAFPEVSNSENGFSTRLHMAIDSSSLIYKRHITSY